MPINGTLLCLGYFQAKYLLYNTLQPKMITSYSLVQVPDPENYINIPSFIKIDPDIIQFLANQAYFSFCIA